MEFKISSYCIQKRGNLPEECEDSCYPQDNGICADNYYKVAIADGATESFFSSIWAKIITRNFSNKKNQDLNSYLTDCHNDWIKWKRDYFLERKEKNIPIQWFEEYGIKKGAYSSMLGLIISKKENLNTYTISALGDSCFFHFRDGYLLESFPIKKSDEFSNSPHLISSENPFDVVTIKKFQKIKRKYRNGDLLILGTDAIAAWILKEIEECNSPTSRLDLIENNEAFISFIDELRDENNIRNDDVTLTLIYVME